MWLFPNRIHCVYLLVSFPRVLCIFPGLWLSVPVKLIAWKDASPKWLVCVKWNTKLCSVTHLAACHKRSFVSRTGYANAERHKPHNKRLQRVDNLHVCLKLLGLTYSQTGNSLLRWGPDNLQANTCAVVHPYFRLLFTHASGLVFIWNAQRFPIIQCHHAMHWMQWNTLCKHYGYRLLWSMPCKSSSDVFGAQFCTKGQFLKCLNIFCKQICPVIPNSIRVKLILFTSLYSST